MNRELIIILICIIFVGFFYLQSDKTKTTYPVVQSKQPIHIQSDMTDTTNTELPDSLSR